MSRHTKEWLPRLTVLAAAAAAYYGAVVAGWAPANPFEWLLHVGQQAREELPKYGMLAPLMYIVLYALQIVIAPIPGAALAYTAGFLFGPVLAPLYSMVAILIGSALGFTLARRIGWPLIERLAPRTWIERWRSLAAVNSSFTWFLLMLAPTADIFYFIAGLTTLSFRRFMTVVLLGRTPGIILSSILGANIETFGGYWIAVLIGVMLLVAYLGHAARVRIERRALAVAEQKVDPN